MFRNIFDARTYNFVEMHGIGAVTNGKMALAWEQLDVNWELVMINLDNVSNRGIGKRISKFMQVRL